ncbi:MAG: hypothetical protein KGJ06_04955 [Pseudomonadota bacterium]|nr:hypothetical protein [Pseudomonadota bacterium]
MFRICKKISAAALLLTLFSGYAMATPTLQPSGPIGQKPLLVIRFNTQHLYYEHALRLAVDSTQKAKPDAEYTVISYTPAETGDSRTSANAEENLHAVAQAIENLGVKPSRIHTASQNASAVASQEIDIFVK